jgi:hypothetical protein
MRWLLALPLLVPALGQADFYARPGGNAPFEIVWQRTAPQERVASAPAPSLVLGASAPQEGGAGTAPLPLFTPNAAVSAPPSGAGGGGATSPIRPGLFFRARLITGLLASPGLASPVLLEAEPTWCGSPSCPSLRLLGLATLATNGRATVVLSQALLDGNPVEADAVVFDSTDKGFGLQGQVLDVAPALAADLIRAAVGGLADWVRALNNQTTVTAIPGGGMATSFQAAPLWAYALGRVGQIVSPPSDATALVRAVVVGAGAEAYVLTGASSLIKGVSGP